MHTLLHVPCYLFGAFPCSVSHFLDTLSAVTNDPERYIPTSRRASRLAKNDLLSRRAATEKEGESGTYLSRAAAFYFYGSVPFKQNARIDFEEKYFSYSARITANNASMTRKK